MTIDLTTRLFIALLPLAFATATACSSTSTADDPPAPTTTQVETVDDSPSGAEETSTGAAEVRALLLARHVDDLPTRAILDKHPNAEQSLHTIAQTDDALIVRARALQLLGLYPTPKSEGLLVSVVSDSAAHAKLRAAALFGLGAYDLEARSDLRGVVIAQLSDSDTRVGVAAVTALAGAPSATVELERVAAETDDDQVREAAQRALARG